MGILRNLGNVKVYSLNNWLIRKPCTQVISNKENIRGAIEVGEVTAGPYHTGICGINIGCWGIYPL
jgi:hypothetical protein